MSTYQYHIFSPYRVCPLGAQWATYNDQRFTDQVRFLMIDKLIMTHTSFLQREHIVPKTLHPKWMFEPLNLCFACDRCNNYKKDDEVLSNPNVEDYPQSSGDFLIVNPFIDRYSDHIELKEGIIYIGKTDKGRFTINTCHLYNPAFALERAKHRMKEEDPDTVLSQLLSLLLSTNTASEEIDKVKRDSEKIVKMYKRLH